MRNSGRGIWLLGGLALAVLGACADGGSARRPGIDGGLVGPLPDGSTSIDAVGTRDAAGVSDTGPAPGCVCERPPVTAARTSAAIAALPRCEPSSVAGLHPDALTRCIAESEIELSARATFFSCALDGGDAGLCVPDALLLSGGARPSPVLCETPFGPGACAPLGVPALDPNAALLNRGAANECAATERCAPCINPLTMESSLACDVVICADDGWRCPDAGPISEIDAAPERDGSRPDAASADDAATSAPDARAGDDAAVSAPDAATSTRDAGMSDPGMCECVIHPVTTPRTTSQIAALPACTPASVMGLHPDARTRCVPDAEITASARSTFFACAGGRCIPEELLITGGVRADPVECASLIGPGACAPLGVPALDPNANLLNRGGGNECSASQRCAPCVDPFTMQSSLACDVVLCAEGGYRCTGDASVSAPDTGPRPDAGPPRPTMCCGGRATCLPREVVAAAGTGREDSLDMGSCAEGDLCVPNEFVRDPTFEPRECWTNAPLIPGLWSEEGRCLSSCIPNTGLFGRGTARDGRAECGSNDKCVPCTAFFAATGACG